MRRDIPHTLLPGNCGVELRQSTNSKTYCYSNKDPSKEAPPPGCFPVEGVFQDPWPNCSFEETVLREASSVKLCSRSGQTLAVSNKELNVVWACSTKVLGVGGKVEEEERQP